MVACGLGKLYDKESVLEYMLAKSGVFVSERATYTFANLSNALQASLI